MTSSLVDSDYSTVKWSSDGRDSNLSGDLEAKIYNEVPVQYFAKRVWGLEPDKAQTIIDNKFKLRQKALDEYTRVLDSEGGLAPELHQPFREICNSLLKDIRDLLSMDHTSLATYLRDKRYSEPCSLGDEVAEARPRSLIDVYISVLEDGSPVLDRDKPSGSAPTMASFPVWSEVRAIFEFKRLDGGRAGDESLTADENQGDLDSYRRCKSSSAGQSASNTSFKTRCKRPLDSNICDNSPRRNKRSRIKKQELVLSTYAQQCFVAGNRHYVTGLFIDGFRVQLWYYDRTAAMRSAYFDFSTPSGTAYLGLVLFALNQCTMRQAGFDPHISRCRPSKLDQPICLPSVTPLERPVVEMKDLCYVFASSDSQQKRVFSVVKVIARCQGITGRATFVLEVKNRVGPDTLSDRLYVLKQSWQLTSREHEGDIITQLRQTLPGWCNHLPDPIFYTKSTAFDLGLPRLPIRDLLLQSGCTDEALKLEDRDLHVIVTNRYKHIWQANDVEEFKRIFLECLECHFHAYNTGCVLHRDISENNLMIYQPGQTDKDPNQSATESEGSSKEPPPTRGILNDFDMAAVLNSDGKVDQSGPSPHHHITGTRPFMACDLLNPSVPKDVHFYRYDLESFLYILMWATAHYDLGKGTYEAPISRAKSYYAKWDKDGHALDKLCLITGTFLVLYAQDVRKEWQGLWGDWVKPLVLMFREAFIELDTARIYGKTDYDYATCDGKITFERFMQTIGATPRGLNPTTAV